MTLCIDRWKRFVGIYMKVDYHPSVLTALTKVFEHRFTHFGLGLRLYNEPRHEKTNILHMQKQRRRSASR